MRRRLHIASSVAAVLAATLIAPAASAQALKTTLVGSGYNRPLYVTSPPGDMQRLFVVEQFVGTTGNIKIIKNGSPLPTPFLSVPGVTNSNEQGLLGLAFHPDYANNGRFFVNCTVAGGGAAGHSEIREYTVSANPDVANTTFTTLLTLNQPQSNHNGGCLQFGPDGFLYATFGDGGNANDTGSGHDAATGNAQLLSINLGKLLRLDVDNGPSYVAAGNPFGTQIWAYGLRNPWRFSFDRATGDLYIGDVGQNAWEEVDFQPASSTGGENYGWRCMEGFHCTGLSGCTCNAPNLVLPIQEYGHVSGNCSITGGYVYRGGAIPALQGTYFYADYCSSQIWSFKYVGGQVTAFTNRTTELDPAGALAINNVTSFGEDANGEMYIVDQSGGEIYRIDQVCPTPSSYCVTSPNSAGPGALMGSSGLGSITANSFGLLTTGCPATVNGLYFFGDGQTQAPMGNGIRCVASNLVRLPVVQTNFFGDAGFTFDFTAPYAAGLLPGSTKNFQFWYRDVPGGGALFNVSDALAVPICQ
jgi:glucose/arabinose dehydrogenase